MLNGVVNSEAVLTDSGLALSICGRRKGSGLLDPIGPIRLGQLGFHGWS